MSDLSMERLEPAANTASVQSQQPRRDASSKSRRRPAPAPRRPAQESPDDLEESPHKIDSLA